MNKEDILEHNRLVYKKIYESIIIRGLDRGLDKRTVDYYVEIHHILPKCMGGSDDESNLVMLTGREHVICHMLLERMYPDNPKLIYAIQRISTSKTGEHLSPRQVDYIRKRFSETRKNPEKTSEMRLKISNTLKEYYKDPEVRRLHGEKMKARIITDEWKQNISKAQTGKKKPQKKPNLSDELREKKAQLCRDRVGEKHPNSKKIMDPSGRIFHSITECAKANGLSRENLSYIVNHSPEKGYKFIKD